MRKINKKGAEFTTSTIIVIVLALLVLVVLAMGFGTGWTNLWSRISGFLSPVNVDSVKQACQYACTTQAVNAFCCQERDVTFEKGKPSVKLKCDTQLLKPIDCDLTCPPNACAGSQALGTPANPFPSLDAATTFCNGKCTEINSDNKKAICDISAFYISGTTTEPKKCSDLGLDTDTNSCKSKCK